METDKKVKLEVLLNGSVDINKDLVSIASMLESYVLGHPDASEMVSDIVQNLHDISRKNLGVCGGIIDFAGLSKTDENDYYHTLAELIDSTDIEFDGIKNTGLDKPLDVGDLDINLK